MSKSKHPSGLKAKQVRALVDTVAWAAGEKTKQDLGFPSEWDQGNYFSNREGVALAGHCGTAGCIAGYVSVRYAKGTPFVNENGVVSGCTLTLPDSDEVETADQVAKSYLGLNELQAIQLFAGDNRLENVVSVVGQILDGVEYPDRHLVSYRREVER